VGLVVAGSAGWDEPTLVAYRPASSLEHGADNGGAEAHQGAGAVVIGTY
jgi:hypothetical protein